jgi:biopolymer transport protein ExbD
MLVLLVIFMITAPLLREGIQMELPKGKGAPLQEIETALFVRINSQGMVYLEKTLLKDPELKPLKLALQKNPETAIYIEADKNVPYGKVIEVLTLIQKYGGKKIQLVTQREE